MPCGLLWGQHVQEGVPGSTELGVPLEGGWGSHNCSLGGADGGARDEADGGVRGDAHGIADHETGGEACDGDESLQGDRSCG